MQWGTADAEHKAPSAKNPALYHVLSLKLKVGQNMAMHASPTARHFFLCNVYLPSRVNFILFSKFSLSLSLSLSHTHTYGRINSVSQYRSVEEKGVKGRGGGYNL